MTLLRFLKKILPWHRLFPMVWTQPISCMPPKPEAHTTRFSKNVEKMYLHTTCLTRNNLVCYFGMLLFMTEEIAYA